MTLKSTSAWAALTWCDAYQVQRRYEVTKYCEEYANEYAIEYASEYANEYCEYNSGQSCHHT